MKNGDKEFEQRKRRKKEKEEEGRGTTNNNSNVQRADAHRSLRQGRRRFRKLNIS
jgi:hypothetical protein